jgi:hypothetical protein
MKKLSTEYILERLKEDPYGTGLAVHGSADVIVPAPSEDGYINLNNPHGVYITNMKCRTIEDWDAFVTVVVAVDALVRERLGG